MTFGERLRMLREERKITQKALSSELNVSPRMISFYENDIHFPRDAKTLIRLAEYFHVSVDFLLGHTETDEMVENLSLFAKYQALPEAERKSLWDYLDFLSSSYLERNDPLDKSASAARRRKAGETSAHNK